MPTYTEDIQTEDFAETDCILITNAGMEALANAPVVPDDAVPDEAEDTADAFTPDTAEKVDWVLGKIADRRAAAARIRENAERMAKAEEREAETLEWWFGPALQAYVRKELAEGKKKSLRLFHGQIGYRMKPASVHVTDASAALSWARESLPGAVVETLDRKALSAALLSTGEALPWASRIPAEEVFFIK